jgi:signal transduction histidine kinase
MESIMGAMSLPSKDSGTSRSAKESALTLRVGHVYLDVRRKRLHCLNDAARELHREGVPFTPADLARQPMRQLAGELVTEAELPLLIAWQQEQPTEAHFLLPRPTEPPWQVTWNASPVRGSTGPVIGVVGTVTCGPRQPDTQKMAELAHDLRSPLQSLRLLCEILTQMPQADVELRKNLGSIQEVADRAVQIALDLLDHCRGPRQRRSDTHRPWFAVEPFLQALAAEQRVTAQAKGLTLIADFQELQGWEMQLDRVRLGRVLANLLSNAVRYTPSGRIDFSARWRIESGQQELVLSVTDTGAGISQEEQESIFQPFERGRAGKESDSSGSGLGLAVVDRLVEELGLELDVYSEYGRGSSFELLVPACFLRRASSCGDTTEM